MNQKENYKSKSYRNLESVGFFLIRSGRGEKLFGLPPNGADDYIRFFLPQFKSYHKERVLMGVVGSIDANILHKSHNDISLIDYFVISIMTVNFRILMNPPFIGKSNASDLNWCALIKKVVEGFPKNKEELQKILAENVEICGVKIDKRDISNKFFQ